MLKQISKIFLLSLLVLGVSSCGYNKIQSLDEDVKAAWGEVENQYKRRSDLIPNLINTVKGYMAHEKEVLIGVTEARAKATSVSVNKDVLKDPALMKKFMTAQSGLSGSLGRLLLSVEKYPDLKANESFQNLMAQLEGTENRIAVARRRYIAIVSEYNKSIRLFPTNLTAKYILHMETRPVFSVSEKEKETPKVQF